MPSTARYAREALPTQPSASRGTQVRPRAAVARRGTSKRDFAVIRARAREIHPVHDRGPHPAEACLGMGI